MPTSDLNQVYSKYIPSSVPCCGEIRYVFPFKDDESSYVFPYSKGAFWVNFRVGRFFQNGMSRTEPIRLSLILRTADNMEHYLLPSKEYRPHTWYSTYWPIPSMPFVDGVGVSLQIEPSGQSEKGDVRVELQGFDRNVSPPSDQYVLTREDGRPLFLFKQSSSSRSCKREASIHDVLDEDGQVTQDMNQELDGFPLRPIGLHQEWV